MKTVNLEQLYTQKIVKKILGNLHIGYVEKEPVSLRLDDHILDEIEDLLVSYRRGVVEEETEEEFLHRVGAE